MDETKRVIVEQDDDVKVIVKPSAASKKLTVDDEHEIGLSWDEQGVHFRVDETDDLPVAKAVDTDMVDGKHASDLQNYNNLTNKPDLKKVATTGSYNDLEDKPEFLKVQVQADWNETNKRSKAYIKNKPTSFSSDGGNADTVDGKHASDLQDYNNLTNKPDIPVVAGNAKNAIRLKDGKSDYQMGEAAVCLSPTAQARGNFSFAEGNNTYTFLENAHAEGFGTIATGSSHAEGYLTIANGISTIMTVEEYSENVVTLGNRYERFREDSIVEFFENAVIGSQLAFTNNLPEGSGNLFIAAITAIDKENRQITLDKALDAESKYSYACPVTANESMEYCTAHAEGNITIATGIASHVEGEDSTASGHASHSEGYGTIAIGDSSHAEGECSKASEWGAHAEGMWTEANGEVSHAEGDGSIATGYASHAEGAVSEAEGDYSHAEGWASEAVGEASHAEGYQTEAVGKASHAEGYQTIVSGENAHAEGERAEAVGKNSHAEGLQAKAIGNYSHAEGNNTISSGKSSHAEGEDTNSCGTTSHAEGNNTISSGAYSHAEGEYTVAASSSGMRVSAVDIAAKTITLSNENDDMFSQDFVIQFFDSVKPKDELILCAFLTKKLTVVSIDKNNYSIMINENLEDWMIPNEHVTPYVYKVDIGRASHAEGIHTTTANIAAHAEGKSTTAVGEASHAEGDNTKAIGKTSHAEGKETKAIGENAHAEGRETKAIGELSHAEGYQTKAEGSDAHAEGSSTISSGRSSHAEGNGSVAIGSGSHAEGVDTIATSDGGMYVTVIDKETKTITLSNEDDEIFHQNTVISFFDTAQQGDKLIVKNIFLGRLTVVSVDKENHTVTVSEDLQDWMLNGYIYKQEKEGFHSSTEGSHAEGKYTVSTGSSSHAEGNNTKAVANYSHAEGAGTLAKGANSHAEGNITKAIEENAHAEGYNTTAFGRASHAEGYNTTAKGEDSHAEGSQSIASGNASHTEGVKSVASGNASHAEGSQSIASGNASHAEGVKSIASSIMMYISEIDKAANVITVSLNDGMPNDNLMANFFSLVQKGDKLAIINLENRFEEKILVTVISANKTDKTIVIEEELTDAMLNKYIYPFELVFSFGDGAHAEGERTIAVGQGAHSEGMWTIAAGNGAYSGGKETVAIGQGAHAEGTGTKAKGENAHTEGAGTKAEGVNAHAEGSSSSASGANTHAEGIATKAKGEASHAEGFVTEASGNISHAEGNSTKAQGDYSHAQGRNTIAEGAYSHAEGYATKAKGAYSHAEGFITAAEGIYAHVEGYNTEANAHQHVSGKYNIDTAGGVASTTEGSALVIGNGTSTSARSNCFRVQFDGKVFSQGEYATTGADYAELFEWEDKNEQAQDRRGLFVALKGTKIHIADSTDKNIIGIISSKPAMVGNNYSETWKDMYFTDLWGDVITEHKTIPAKYEAVNRVVFEKDENGEEKQVVKEEQILVSEAYEADVPVLNPDYNKEAVYIPRHERKEWGIVGMLGQLIVQDDGSCEADGYCKCADGGIATKAQSGYYIMERIDASHIRVLFK